MKIKRTIYTILLMIWMIIIFLFSNQNASNSQSTSDKVASSIVDTVEIVTNQEISEKKKDDFITNTRVLIRKSAHFILYFVLGILSFLTLRSYQMNRKILFYSVLFCFIYAISDEIHQLFSYGRTAKIMDVLIDTSGSFLGSCLCLIKFNK